MRVLEVIPLDKKKSKVIVEGTETFALYRGELRKYGIADGAELTEQEIEEIYREILYKRGKERALYILKDSDKTEQEMRTKLKKGYYPEEIIDKVIEFLQKYRYVDDWRYAENYIHFYSNSKSRRMIVQKLLQKGLAKELISEVYEHMEEELQAVDEREQIYKLLEKKRYCAEEADYKEQNRIMGFLVRKGFQLDDVLYCMKHCPESKV